MVCLAWSRGLLAWKFPRIAPARVLGGMLAVWLIVKVLFVEVVLDQRPGAAADTGQSGAVGGDGALDRTLYLFRVKDEGIMFYFGRSVVRLAEPGGLPSAQGPYSVF